MPDKETQAGQSEQPQPTEMEIRRFLALLLEIVESQQASENKEKSA